MLDAVGLTGAVPDPAGRDLLGVVSRNANPSKIDQFLERSTSAVVRWNPRTGEVGSTVTVTLENTAPTSGLRPTVIGNALGLPTGTNAGDLALLTGLTLLRTTIDGTPLPSRSEWDGRRWYHQARVVIPPGGTVKVRFELEGLVAAGETYRMVIVGQPLVNPTSMTVKVVPTTGAIAATDGVKVTRGEATVSTDGARDRVLRFRLR